MEELKGLYEPAHRETMIRLNFGASGMLAQQVDQGAPVDVFFSAAAKPMDALAAKGLILPETRRDLLRNEVVLVAPQGSTKPHSFQELADRSVKLIALGEPETVPAGDYGRQVLQSLGLWQQLQPKLVLAKDVRQVLTYVETGEADAGIVYATDARESGKVRVAAVAPENAHQPVLYPVAVIKGSRHVSAARAFAEFLGGPQARMVFLRHGFTPVAP
jgi:molybdate transport system substrate-binding protein